MAFVAYLLAESLQLPFPRKPEVPDVDKMQAVSALHFLRPEGILCLWHPLQSLVTGSL